MRSIKKIISPFKRFKKCQRGIASIEFSIWAAVLAVPLLLGLEYGIYHMSNIKIDKALNAGVITAFDTRDNIDEDYLASVVKASYPQDGFAVSIYCNGEKSSCVNTNRECACISNGSSEGGGDADEAVFYETVGTVKFTRIDSCSSTCPSGAAPGYYLTIETSVDTPRILKSSVSPPAKIDSVTIVKLQ